nr:uncharacterized protein LOC115261173 [Aedes albopictus]
MCVGKALTRHGIQNYTGISAVGKFRFKVSFQTIQDARKLTEINLTDENLKCYLPVILKQTVGFARDIPRSYSEEEIKENLVADVEIIKVERVRKMDQNGKLRET